MFEDSVRVSFANPCANSHSSSDTPESMQWLVYFDEVDGALHRGGGGEDGGGRRLFEAPFQTTTHGSHSGTPLEVSLSV